MLRKVVVFGGNGFVGSKVLEQLVRGAAVLEEEERTFVSVSRSGVVPAHLKTEPRAQRVTWSKGDAMDPESCLGLLADASAVVVSVGSPPLPFVDYDAQFAANGTANETILSAAKKVPSMKKAVLVNATMPSWAPKGYRDGKLAAEEAAKALSENFSVTILKPSAIYGTRHLQNGMPLPLWPALAPVSWLLEKGKPLCDRASGAFPSLFDGVLAPPVPVDALASAAVHALTQSSPALTTFTPFDILAFRQK